MPIDRLFKDYSRSKDRALHEHDAVLKDGEDLVRWLNTPILINDRLVLS